MGLPIEEKDGDFETQRAVLQLLPEKLSSTLTKILTDRLKDSPDSAIAPYIANRLSNLNIAEAEEIALQQLQLSLQASNFARAMLFAEALVATHFEDVYSLLVVEPN